MIGYRNERYQYFGTAAAKLDDILNYIPARISVYLMILAAFFARYDAKEAFRVYRRDKRNHASPNSAHTEVHCIFNWPAMHITLENCTKSRPSAMPTVPLKQRIFAEQTIYYTSQHASPL